LSVCKESEPGSQVVNIPCAVLSQRNGHFHVGRRCCTTTSTLTHATPLVYSGLYQTTLSSAAFRKQLQAMGFPIESVVTGAAASSLYHDFLCAVCSNVADHSNALHTTCTHGACSAATCGVLRCGAVAQTRAVFRDTWRTVVALSQLTPPQSSAAPASRSGSTTGPPARPATRPSATTRSHRCEPLLRLSTAFWAACGWPARCRAAPGRAT
jgi:hypothetical protein